MLPSAVRRVVSVATQSPVIGSIASSSGSRTAAASASATLSLGCRASRHQRRCSSSNSSNPSSPDNGSKDFSADRAIPAQSAKSSTNSDKRKRRAKDALNRPAVRALPSVPSTQHLPRESLALSAFFSLHRPISITHSLPRAVSDDAFASIFVHQSPAGKMGEVMSTLSQTVQDLEQPMANLGILGQQREADTGEGMSKITLKHADGSETGMYVQLNAMSGRFLPFCPPPLPEPEATGARPSEAFTAATAATASKDGGADLEDASAAVRQAIPSTHANNPHRRIYNALLTIEETVDESGSLKFVAHSSQLVEQPVGPRTFLERMALRQLRFEGSQTQDDGMIAISVKRQRKLKMKKKKYKKLMRKTRNIRRKLDRT